MLLRQGRVPPFRPFPRGVLHTGSWGTRIGRHEEVQKGLELMCKEIGLTTKREPRVFEDDRDEDDKGKSKEGPSSGAASAANLGRSRTDLRVITGFSHRGSVCLVQEDAVGGPQEAANQGVGAGCDVGGKSYGAVARDDSGGAKGQPVGGPLDAGDDGALDGG